MQRGYQLDGGRLVESQGEQPWVSVFVRPDEQERRFLIDTLKIDEHTLTSALDPDELARLEFEPDHVALIFKKPKNYSAEENFLFKVDSGGLFLFKDRLVLVVSEDGLPFESKPFIRIRSLVDVMLRVIFHSISHFLGHLKVINMISDELEDKINASMENKYLLNLFTLEKSLVYYLSAIHSNGLLIEKVRHNLAKIGITPEEAEYLDDIIVENSQCYKQAEIYSNVLSGLMDARVSVVSNNLNVLMKTLNLITIGIMVPTFVVSAFSMNIPLPWGMGQYPPAFFMVMGLAAASVAALLWYWWYKKL